MDERLQASAIRPCPFPVGFKMMTERSTPFDDKNCTKSIAHAIGPPILPSPVSCAQKMILALRIDGDSEQLDVDECASLSVIIEVLDNVGSEFISIIFSSD